jgi:succinoglycan biosynthesis protein ExoV
MKLYYYQAHPGNFGDDLNLWLWPRLLGDPFAGVCHHDRALSAENEREEVLFLGIGTLLNRTVPTRPMKLVFGSGTGYGDPPRIDDRWHFRAVRGPLTARALGLPVELGIGDPGTLVRVLALPPAASRERVAFMPHVQSATVADWRIVCEDLGIRYIDPTVPVDRVLSLIQGSDTVITEAMHGAIVCDALRVPWIPVVCYDRINAFKWDDWCATLGLEYRPTRLPSLWPTPPLRQVRARLEKHVKLIRVRRALRTLMSAAAPVLSTDVALDAVTRRLQVALQALTESDLAPTAVKGSKLATVSGAPHGK